MPTMTAVPRPAELQAQRGPQPPANIVAAVRNASARTGVDFAYLMEKAAVESGYRTDVKAQTSSATGLYQFIDSTWLGTMKEHGAQHGYQRFADAIQRRSDGSYHVADPSLRREILDLRKNPEVSALFAAEFTRDNKEYLEQEVGGRIGATEMYLAHFLGAGGAAKFIEGMRQFPDRHAATLFPEAAAANRNVFYDRVSGRALSLKEVYNRFQLKFANDISNAVVGERPEQQGTGGEVSGGLGGGRATTPLAGKTLSMYTILALNALETPLDSEGERNRPSGGGTRVRQEALQMQPFSGLGVATAQAANPAAALAAATAL